MRQGRGGISRPLRDGGLTMNDRRSIVTLYAKIALILYLIRFGVSLLIELFPAAVFGLFGQDARTAAAAGQFNAVLRFLPLICGAGVFLVCWYLVQASVKSNTKESAKLALTVILAVLVINPVASLISGHFSVLMLAHGAGSEDVAAYSLLKTAESYAALISCISYPLLAAAAAVNRWRFED